MSRTSPLLLVFALLGSCSDEAPEPAQLPEPPEAVVEASAPASERPSEPEPTCVCILSSWVVMGQGRHLHLDIDCPDGFDHLDGRVEFTSATLRTDYDPATVTPGALPALVRMTPGRALISWQAEPDPRVEARYEVPVSTAAWFQRDVAFSEPYVLIGANSNSAMRTMLEHAGLELPSQVLEQGTAFGAFPGLLADIGTERDADDWPAIGLPDGPIERSLPLPEPPASFGTIGAPSP